MRYHYVDLYGKFTAPVVVTYIRKSKIVDDVEVFFEQADDQLGFKHVKYNIKDHAFFDAAGFSQTEIAWLNQFIKPCENAILKREARDIA